LIVPIRTQAIIPRFTDVNHILPREFLEGQWDLDILPQEGLKKMQEIVAYIKVEAAKV
jgi:hypothetical protein